MGGASPEFQGCKAAAHIPRMCFLFPWKSPLEIPKGSEFKVKLGQVINKKWTRGCAANLQLPLARAAQYLSWNKRCHEGRWAGAAKSSLKPPPWWAGSLELEERGNPSPTIRLLQRVQETTPTSASKISCSRRAESCKLLRWLTTAEVNHLKSLRMLPQWAARC